MRPRMLAAVLVEARAKGIDQALLTCDVDNVASRKVIEANGGVLEDQDAAQAALLGADRPCLAWEDGRSPNRPLGKQSVSVAPAAPVPGATDPAIIRNFCIIAHIDHGKSTLADRMLQLTGVVDERDGAGAVPRPDGHRARARHHDQEPGRADAVDGRSRTTTPRAEPGTYVLNMIDTPGHVDFTYEVSRSLEACEAAVLLVDAAQGIEAQTLANLYLALGADLHIIPVLNKIDLPSAQPEKYAAELAGIIGCDPSDVLRVSRQDRRGRRAPAQRDRRADPGARSATPTPRRAR